MHRCKRLTLCKGALLRFVFNPRANNSTNANGNLHTQNGRTIWAVCLCFTQKWASHETKFVCNNCRGQLIKQMRSAICTHDFERQIKNALVIVIVVVVVFTIVSNCNCSSVHAVKVVVVVVAVVLHILCILRPTCNMHSTNATTK